MWGLHPPSVVAAGSPSKADGEAVTRATDKAHANALGYALELSALVAAVRADRFDALPRDPVFALAVVALSMSMDQDALVELLVSPDATFEAACAHMHTQVRRLLLRRAIDDLINKAKDMKGNPT